MLSISRGTFQVFWVCFLFSLFYLEVWSFTFSSVLSGALISRNLGQAKKLLREFLLYFLLTCCTVQFNIHKLLLAAVSISQLCLLIHVPDIFKMNH